MNILEVVPIAKSVAKETLTYFTANDVMVGSIVKVPLRKKTVPALVIKSVNMLEAKSAVKQSPFALKRVEKVKATRLLSPAFIRACEHIATYYATYTGTVASALVPHILFEKAEVFTLPEHEHGIEHTAKEHYLIQSPDEERYAQYKSIIREEFVRGGSVFFCLPTIQDIKKAHDILSKGIERYTFILHGLLNKKQVTETVQAILAEKHPILIIATAGFLSVPKQNVSTIILDRESSRAYKQLSRPYLDLRTCAELIAKETKARIIFGDMIVRVETMYRHKQGELFDIVPLKFRSLSTATESLVDMRTQKAPEHEKQGFSLFSHALLSAIMKNVEENEHMFIFAARRGLSPSTVCSDCGTIFACNTCGAHTVLHSAPSGNFFLCHNCGERRNAHEACRHCGGWRLAQLGIGIERVEEELKRLFPNGNFFRIDADKTPTHAKALAVAEKFYAAPQGILVGTERALLYLDQKIENSAVASMDTFFAIPDFRINERVLGILLKMRSITDRTMIIQTRDAEQKVFGYAHAGNLIDFFRDETEDRKRLSYPPFATIIKISVSGKKQQATDAMEKAQTLIAPYAMDVFPAFIPEKKGLFAIHGIVRLAPGAWPDPVLVEKLRSLPQNFSVNVDPESLL